MTANQSRLKHLRNEIFNKIEKLENKVENVKIINNMIESEKYVNILVIDDDEISNFITKLTLERNNLINKITIFDNPIEGLKYLSSTHNIPDIIFLDIKMPYLDGFEVYDKIKKMNLCSKIIFLSSSINLTDKEKVKNTQFISKPLTENTLKNIL